jgi:hypothetical protein
MDTQAGRQAAAVGDSGDSCILHSLPEALGIESLPVAGLERRSSQHTR